jgi:hypothetical protein
VVPLLGWIFGFGKEGLSITITSWAGAAIVLLYMVSKGKFLFRHKKTYISLLATQNIELFF